MGPTKANKPTVNEVNDIVLSPNPNRAMQEMMDTIDTLRGIIIQENVALESTDTNAFMSLQARKLDAARSYQSGVTQLLARKDELRKADPSLKKRLEALQADFHLRTVANLGHLERMRHGMERLGERIMSMARESAQKQQQFVYSARGEMHTGGKASIGINESA